MLSFFLIFSKLVSKSGNKCIFLSAGYIFKADDSHLSLQYLIKILFGHTQTFNHDFQFVTLQLKKPQKLMIIILTHIKIIIELQFST